MDTSTRVIDCFFFEITIFNTTPKPTTIVPPRRPLFFTEALVSAAKELKL